MQINHGVIVYKYKAKRPHPSMVSNYMFGVQMLRLRRRTKKTVPPLRLSMTAVRDQLRMRNMLTLVSIRAIMFV